MGLVVTLVVAGTACSGDAAPPTVAQAPDRASLPATTTLTPTTDAPTTEPPVTTSGPVACPRFSDPAATASLQSAELNEISGLVVGRAAPDTIWVHNDSGGGAMVYGVGVDGDTRTEITLEGIFALDWEDMDIGPEPDGAGSLLYVADIGDNLTLRPTVIVHRFVEPDGSVASVTVQPESLVLTYPDGPRDAEAMVVDPQTNQLVIITKQDATIYTAPLTAFADGRAELVRAGRLPGPIGLVTAASTDARGDWIAVRTPQRILLWPRSAGLSMAETLDLAPCEPPAPLEKQGEALGLSPDGLRYVTISEGTGASILVSYRE